MQSSRLRARSVSSTTYAVLDAVMRTVRLSREITPVRPIPPDRGPRRVSSLGVQLAHLAGRAWRASIRFDVARRIAAVDDGGSCHARQLAIAPPTVT